MKHACLKLEVVEESHTGQFIANQIKSSLKEYEKDIDDPILLRQCVGNTTDTAANEKNAGYLFFIIMNDFDYSIFYQNKFNFNLV